MQSLTELKSHGFDRSYEDAVHLYPRCSRCSPRMAGAVPQHEHGCANTKSPCKGCGVLLPAYGPSRYCDDCRSR